MKWTKYNRKSGAVIATGDTDKGDKIPDADKGSGVLQGQALAPDEIVALASDLAVPIEVQLAALVKRVAALEAAAKDK